MRHIISIALALAACGPVPENFDSPPLDPSEGGPITTTTTGESESSTSEGTTAEPVYPCDAWIGCYLDACLPRCDDDACLDACASSCAELSDTEPLPCMDVFCAELVDACAHDEPGACADLPVCFPEDTTSTGTDTGTTGTTDGSSTDGESSTT